MRFDADSGWFPDLRHCPSPNFSTRPAGAGRTALRDIDLIVIHGISLPPGRFLGDAVERLFQNRLDANAHPYFAGIADLRVSAHFLVRRNGALVQCVSLYDRAWHAGRSSFDGRADCNDFSVGIEVEGTDADPCNAFQFARLVKLTKAVMREIGLRDAQRVVGHVDVAPGRKTDPGPNFPWEAFRGALDAGSGKA